MVRRETVMLVALCASIALNLLYVSGILGSGLCSVGGGGVGDAAVYTDRSCPTCPSCAQAEGSGAKCEVAGPAATSTSPSSAGVHQVVHVRGVGPMIAIAMPVWRLTGSASAAAVETDAPQQEGAAPAEGTGVEPTAAIEESPVATHSAALDEAVPSTSDTRRHVLARGSAAGAQQRPAPGRLVIPDDTSRLMVDIGTFVSSPCSKRWWYFDDKAFVVAFEPNIMSGMLLTRVAHPAFNTQLGGYWPSCPLPESKVLNRTLQLDSLQRCLNTSYGHITRHIDRFALFPVALSNEPSYASFQYGFPGRADSGSLLAFSREATRKRKAKPLFALPTPVMRLSSILRYLPTHTNHGDPLLWDTLKIDAQGVDSLIIEGAGELLKNFACVLGEFDTSSYKARQKFNYKNYLVNTLGFIMLRRTTFIHPSKIDVVLKKKALCFSTDVAVDYGKLAAIAAKMKKE